MFLFKLILGIFKGITRLLLSLLSLLLVAGLFVWWAHHRTDSFAAPYLYDDVQKVPYKARRIRIIIVSGDNADKSYNEPVAMRKALIARGIPKAHIVLDFAGFRTLDTVIRCRDVFGQQRVVFISQPFQNARAVYIGRHNQMDIIGFNAWSFTQAREWVARARMMLDVHLLDTSPKFLGEQVPLPR